MVCLNSQSAIDLQLKNLIWKLSRQKSLKPKSLPKKIRYDHGTDFTVQGSHSEWKTWKNGKAFSSQGKVGEF